MKPTEIAITRKFNLGNYQTMDITVKASLGEGEDPVQALHALERLIMDYWDGRASSLVSRQVGRIK
jgi:predicted Zn-dependent protease with MMP-like domain